MNTNAVSSANSVDGTHSVGRIKRTYAVRVVAGARASNDATYRPAVEITAWANRSAAANGFGEAIVEGSQSARPAAMQGQFASGAAINASLREIAASVATAARRLAAAWRRSRDQRATYIALSALDARTLRDVGLDASEIRSVATELSGISDPTRAHALMSLRNLAV